MAKQLVRQTDNYTVYRDDKTGVACVTCGDGNLYTCHPNIDKTGSVRGMKQLGYWGKKDRVARCFGFIYNIDRVAVSSPLDDIAAQMCMCEACANRKY